MQILQHLLPDRDLTPEALREIARDLRVERSVSQQIIENPQTQKHSGHHNVEKVAEKEAEPDNEDIGDLHEQLGCLMKDSLGEYRESLEPQSSSVKRVRIDFPIRLRWCLLGYCLQCDRMHDERPP